MISINRGNLLYAFTLAGWLDTKTGEIRKCDMRMQSDGKYNYVIEPDMLQQPDRFVRLPYISDTKILVDFIETKGIEQAVLEEYGVDINKNLTDNYFVNVAYDELGWEGDKSDFTKKAFYMIESLDLEEEFHEFSDKRIIEIIECWCQENGLSLCGTWDDWMDPNNVNRLIARGRIEKAESSTEL